MAKNFSTRIRYISLREASKISGYHPDYLSYLIRKGKMDGMKIGKNWVTTPEAVKNYVLTKKFFPLKDIIFSKLSPKVVLGLGVAAILILSVAFSIFTSPPFFQKSPGDFIEKKLKTKDLREIKVTTYFSDELGGVEISVQPKGAFQETKKEPSLLQKIKRFFTNFYD